LAEEVDKDRVMAEEGDFVKKPLDEDKIFRWNCNLFKNSVVEKYRIIWLLFNDL